jgi:hypothetical protein
MLPTRPYQGRPEMICCSSENFGKGQCSGAVAALKWLSQVARARWSFGCLLDWHLIHGTRNGDVGRPWTTNTLFQPAVVIAAIRQQPLPISRRTVS